MEKVVRLLMRRDNISKEEAEQRVKETLCEIDEAIHYGAGIEEVEEIVMDNLGLEPDFIEGLLMNL